MARQAINVGRKAPAFALENQDGEKVALKDLLGRWVVLYFYPKDNTSGCTTEACEFTAGIAEFQEMDAAVIGVSPDSAASHRKFIAKHTLKVELLSDPDHQVMTQYGAWGEKTMYGKKVTGVIRSTVVIAPDGKIAWHWPKVKAAGHAEQAREKLVALRGG
ncbi:MAG: peroxiredoxin [Phycisphaerae bacterium]|nr:peroxiredoxin [Phycisphaerae bacterium]